MASKKLDIVFFTPTLGRSGSEIVLLNLLSFTKGHNVTVVARYKGELYDSLPAHVNRKYLYKNWDHDILSRLGRMFRKLFVTGPMMKGLRGKTWYINTMVMPEVIAYAEQHAIPAIVHVHELEQMYEGLSADQLKRLAGYPALVIANSNASAAVLKAKGRVKPMEVIYPAIDAAGLVYDKVIAAAYRKKLGIAENEFAWMMCGWLDANKNPALFLEIARALKAKGSPVKMIWIGGTDSQVAEWRERSAKEGLSGLVTFTGEVGDEFRKYFMAADGLLLTSQRESFSMITAEARLLGLPVVANNCGGVSEVLGPGSDAIVAERNNLSQLLAAMEKHMQQPKALRPDEGMKRFDKGEIGKKWIDLLIHGLPG